MLHEYRDEITALKQTNAHFARIFNDHNELDQQVEDAVEGRTPLSDVEIEVMKKKKLLLKDEMLKMIMDHKKANQ
ncbi:MAG: YdcH family protein [Campylobacterales bacterium]|nr:YdcH family protein [Campylobacterales bacterium]